MVQTLKSQDSGLRAYVVLRAIFIGGQRVEPGAQLQLTRALGTELAAANKVAAEGTPAADQALQAAAAAVRAAKAEKKKPAAEAREDAGTGEG